LTEELIRQSVVRLFEIRAEAEDSAVDAGLCLALKKRPVVVILEHEPLVDAVDHFASLLAPWVETEVFQDDKSVEGKKQAWIFVRPASVAGRRLKREKLSSPALCRDARSLRCNRVGRFIGEVLHHLPPNRRIRIEEPFEVRGPGVRNPVGASISYNTRVNVMF